MYVHRKIRSYTNVLYTIHVFGWQPSLDITNLLRQSPKVYYDKGLLYAFSFISFSMEHTAWNVLQKATENSILVQLLIFTTVYICYHLEHDCCNVFIMMTQRTLKHTCRCADCASVTVTCRSDGRTSATVTCVWQTLKHCTHTNTHVQPVWGSFPDNTGLAGGLRMASKERLEIIRVIFFRLAGV